MQDEDGFEQRKMYIGDKATETPPTHRPSRNRSSQISASFNARRPNVTAAGCPGTTCIQVYTYVSNVSVGGIHGVLALLAHISQ